jgi:Fe-S cluster assembly ATPase SufC
LITHYQRILRYVTPDFVHVMVDGRVALSGGAELAQKLEEKGYGWIKGVEEGGGELRQPSMPDAPEQNH